MSELETAVDMGIEAVRAHKTSGVRLGSVHEVQDSYRTLITRKCGDYTFNGEVMMQINVLNDTRYAVYTATVVNLNFGEVDSVTVQLMFCHNITDADPESSVEVFETSTMVDGRFDPRPFKTDEEVEVVAEEINRMVALAINAAERHRDLVAPPEEPHHCGNPDCEFEGQMSSELGNPKVPRVREAH